VYLIGPSGAGKDTLMEAAAEADPRVRPARRFVTRAGGGRWDVSVSRREFGEMLDAGLLLFHWESHGFSYGVPAEDERSLPPERVLIVNGSREYLGRAARIRPGIAAVMVTARQDVLRQRLTARGREAPDAIERRLARGAQAFAAPEGVAVYVLDNSGALRESVLAFLAIVSGMADGRRREVPRGS
jgi:ribose 1,5-bisphosphokinase